MKKTILLITLLTLLSIGSCYYTNKISLSSNVNTTEVYKTISIDAKAAIAYNISKEEIIAGKNINCPLLTASIIKILTCITAIENIDINKYILIDEWITSAVGSKIYLQKGDFVCIKDLLYGLILESGNDAALALCYAYSPNPNDFILKMQELVNKLKLKNTIINNPSGLDELNENYSSCYDMAIITKYAMGNSLFREIFGTKKYNAQVNERTLYFHHKHRLVQNLPSVIGGKTGYTKKAGRTLVTVFNNNGELIIVVTMRASNDWLLHQELSQYDE